MPAQGLKNFSGIAAFILMRGSGRPPEKTSRKTEYARLFHHAPSQTNFQDKHGSGEQEGGGYGEDHAVAEGGGGREADK